MQVSPRNRISFDPLPYPCGPRDLNDTKMWNGEKCRMGTICSGFYLKHFTTCGPVMPVWLPLAAVEKTKLVYFCLLISFFTFALGCDFYHTSIYLSVDMFYNFSLQGLKSDPIVMAEIFSSSNSMHLHSVIASLPLKFSLLVAEPFPCWIQIQGTRDLQETSIHVIHACIYIHTCNVINVGS